MNLSLKITVITDLLNDDFGNLLFDISEGCKAGLP